jgi:hypothetical protein
MQGLQTDAAALSARPWRRLHFSTWILIFLLAAFFMVVEIPGTLRVVILSSAADARGSFKHGWPCVFLERKTNSATCSIGPQDIDRAPWLAPGSWMIPDGFEWQRLSLLCLIADILISLAIILVVAGLFEWRRRFRSRLFQFTLRELLLFVLLAAAACSWWRVNHNRRTREKEIIARFAKRGSLVFCIDKYGGPEILEKTLGRDLLDDFYAVAACRGDLWDKQDYEETMSCIDNLPSLESVEFGDFGRKDAAVIDQWLSRMTTLKNLQTLNLSGSKLADSGVEIISRMSRLTELLISETSISNRGIQSLRSLSLLETLRVDHTSIDDGAGDTLSQLKNLTDLDVSSTKLTDKSVVRLGKLSKLKQLDISYTDITRKGVQELQSLLPECQILAYEQRAPVPQ